jgi:hypothetical protein
MQEFTLEMFQLLAVFGILFIAAFVLISVAILGKGYQLNVKNLRPNFTIIMVGLLILAASLGIFIVMLIGMPNFVMVFPIPGFAGDTYDLIWTTVVITFIVSLFSGLFLMYTKRGGL